MTRSPVAARAVGGKSEACSIDSCSPLSTWSATSRFAVVGISSALKFELAGGRVEAVRHGDLATILAFCDASERKSKLPGVATPGSSLSVVAGIGFEPMTFRL